MIVYSYSNALLIFFKYPEINFLLLLLLLHVACGILIPNQGLNLCPLHWKHRVLTNGLPGKSLSFLISTFFEGLLCVNL